MDGDQDTVQSPEVAEKVEQQGWLADKLNMLTEHGNTLRTHETDISEHAKLIEEHSKTIEQHDLKLQATVESEGPPKSPVVQEDEDTMTVANFM